MATDQSGKRRNRSYSHSRQIKTAGKLPFHRVHKRNKIINHIPQEIKNKNVNKKVA